MHGDAIARIQSQELLSHAQARRRFFDQKDIDIEPQARCPHMFNKSPLITDTLPVLRLPRSNCRFGITGLSDFVG
jgi:hypothetical protein